MVRATARPADPTTAAFGYESDRRTFSGNSAFMDYDDSVAIGMTDAQSRASANTIGGLIYLGPSVAGRDTTKDLGLTGYKGPYVYPTSVNISYIQSPTGEIRTGTVRVHSVDNDSFERMATGITLSRDKLDTQAAVLQSHWWNGALVTT